MRLLPKLEEVVARVTPIEQQGFLRGGRIYASYMALYALIERARVQGQRLHVAFVDVRKAFPSVRRDLLWRKLKVELGAPDELVAALIALYTDACATVRGPDGRSDTFGISLGTREGGVEAPLLYILFVADLVAMLQDVSLTDGEATLDGHPVRALQLADDLALIAESEDDLSRLLAQWSKHCDLNHQETQIAKTEVVIFTCEGDGDLVMVEGQVRLGEGEPLEFRYKANVLSVVQSFVYLGVLYDSNLGPMSALEYRDDKGWKVLGALKNSLRMVPFLPFARVAEMGEAMVGGTFLYSAELWAPYLDLRRARVPRAYAAWLHGFGKKARADRLVGWVPARDLDIKAETAVVRMLADAQTHGGLLQRALSQLRLNWVEACRPGRRRMAKDLWWGRMLKMVRRTWGRFDVLMSPRVVFTGLPRARVQSGIMHTQYAADVWVRRWQNRQLAVLRASPTFFSRKFC